MKPHLLAALLALSLGCQMFRDESAVSSFDDSTLSNPRAQPFASLGSPLASIAHARPGRAMHESSWDRTNGNADMRTIKPGQTLTIFDHEGAGIIRRFWVTIAPRADMKLHRQAILRMYWDGDQTPAVECPIGDFFGVGFGEQRDYISLPLNQTSGGYNCYWPMPFHKSARWTVTNQSDKDLGAFYYNIDYTAYDSLPADLLHFHARWNRQNPTQAGQNYTILETKGRGHYVGVALFMQAIKPAGLGFLEGDEMITIDDHAYASPDVSAKHRGPPLVGGPGAGPGEGKGYFASPTTRPQVIGTGTEDYFSSGWYYDRGLYSAPYHGITIKDDPPGRVSTYRWHIEDAMPYEKSIKVEIEHGHGRIANDHQADYSSIAFFYQNESSPSPNPITTETALLPTIPPPVKRIAGMIEAEAMAAASKPTSGMINTQSMGAFIGEWSGESQLFWTNAKLEENPTATLHVKAPAAGSFKLIGYFTRAPDYGTIQLFHAAHPIGQPQDLYSDKVEPTGPIELATIPLQAGDNPITVKIVGKNPKSTNVLVGIDGFMLKN